MLPTAASRCSLLTYVPRSSWALRPEQQAYLSCSACTDTLQEQHVAGTQTQQACILCRLHCSMQQTQKLLVHQ